MNLNDGKLVSKLPLALQKRLMESEAKKADRLKQKAEKDKESSE